MPYGYKIQYTDPVTDITAAVSRFTITASRQNYCREMTLEIADPSFYAALPLARIPSATSVEIFTRTGEEWFSQGRFFIERPAMAHEIESSMARGVWGRSETAALGEPFASKRSISVEADTTFFTLAADLVNGAGLSWDLAESDIADYPVYAYTYARENAYPIDILSELAEYAGAHVTTSRTGSVRIAAINYEPAAADLTLDDDQIQNLSENPEWPAFGNRIRITPAGDLAGFRVNVTVPDPCMPADNASARRVFARLTDADGDPVQNVPIQWDIKAASALLATSKNNTATRLMPAEETRAKNYYNIDVTFPPSSVRGVWTYADKARRHNLAAAGYQTDGRTITLADPLQFCDQLVIVEYFSKGVAVNLVYAGTRAEDVIVSASVDGAAASGEVYIGNACKCPPSIDLEAIPSSIEISKSAALVVYAEESGPVTDGRAVYITHTNDSALGSLSWGRARLGRVKLKHERASATNQVAGVTQVQVSRYISSVDGVWRASAEGAALGGNLFAGAFAEKTIDLNTALDSGTDLLVTYTAIGAARCRFDALENPGTAHFRTWMRSNREAPVEDTENIRIQDPSDPYDDNADTDDGGTGGGSGGGDDGGLDPIGEGLCRNADGEDVQCGDDQECCVGPDGNYGCWPPDQCKQGSIPEACAPTNLSTNPEVSEAERFDAAREQGCTCEEMCRAELDTYGTTQTFDDASYRTTGQIAEQDYGLEPGSPEYNETVSELEQSALDQCLAECDECDNVEAVSPAESNPETMDPPGSVSVSVIGGAGPFTWSVSGVDGYMEVNQTEGRSNVLTVEDPEACGSAVITITDQTCGDTCEIGVRMTNGKWVLTARMDCPVTGPETDTLKLVKGAWKIEEKAIVAAGFQGFTYDKAECEEQLNGYIVANEDKCATSEECDPDAGCDTPGACIDENKHPLVDVFQECERDVDQYGRERFLFGVRFWCIEYRRVYEWVCPYP